MEGGEVTLKGTVDSRTAKRRAEDIAESVSGVTNVENRLRVRQGMRTGVTAGTRSADAAAGATGTAGAAAAGAGTTATGGTGAETT